MSANGRSGKGDADAVAEALDLKWVVRHRGSEDDYMTRYRQAAARLASTLKAARVAYSALTRLLHPTGLHVKERPAEAIRRVAHGESVTWMGFAIQVVASDLRCTVTDEAW